MYVIRLGEPYPFNNITTGDEQARARLTENFFDVVYYLNPGLEEVQQWRRGPILYGVLEAAPGVPFVLVQFPAIHRVFDVTLQLRGSATGFGEAWAQLATNASLSFYLINASTNLVEGLRIVPVEAAFVRQVRAIGARQLAAYPDQVSVLRAVEVAEQIPLRAMMRHVTWYTAE